MQPDSELEAIEKQFVCVRVIQTNSLDLNVFQYDYDMSWAAMFLNADMTIYGRYGSRNAGGKDSSDGLLSLPAFKKAAERALKLHAAYPANKSALAAKTGVKPEYTAPTRIPGLTEKPVSAADRRECIHCHMVKEFALRAKWQAGRLSLADLWVHPLPQNIGITTDLDDGLRVNAIAPGSPAAAAGFAPGDDLLSINNQPLISLADIQWALHTAPTEGQLAVQLNRGGQAITKTIPVRGDWKKSDIAWRASSWYGLRQGVKFEPLPAAEKKAHGIADDSLALVVKGLFGQGGPKLKEAGVKLNDIIVAVDGRTEAMSEGEFLTYLRLTHGPKDSVKFTILSGQERRELTILMW
jgi:membrane-associated protease RseP (regulator of RpoE activity)